jgi:hypothetical protein
MAGFAHARWGTMPFGKTQLDVVEQPEKLYSDARATCEPAAAAFEPTAARGYPRCDDRLFPHSGGSAEARA